MKQRFAKHLFSLTGVVAACILPFAQASAQPQPAVVGVMLDDVGGATKLTVSVDPTLVTPNGNEILHLQLQPSLTLNLPSSVGGTPLPGLDDVPLVGDLLGTPLLAGFGDAPLLGGGDGSSSSLPPLSVSVPVSLSVAGEQVIDLNVNLPPNLDANGEQPIDLSSPALAGAVPPQLLQDGQ